MADQLPRPPVPIDVVLEDPGLVDRLVTAHAPYWPVQRYMSNRAEYATLSGSSTGGDPAGEMPVAPVFRGDWAYDGRVSDGVEELLHHPSFVEGARALFDAEIVRPHTVYVNLTWQLPFAQGRGHVDIPAFRGYDRSTVPVTFLTILGQTGLFEAERVKVATAVSWFYRGADGGFEYWPDGPGGQSIVHEGVIHNTGIVGDNDFMWHRVRPVGRPEDGMVSLSLDSELHRAGDSSWEIRDHGQVVASFDDSRLRVGLSWKGDVFDSEWDRGRHDDHEDDLDEGEVLRRLEADLAAKGLDSTIPTDDATRDPEFIERLANAYMRYPA